MLFSSCGEKLSTDVCIWQTEIWNSLPPCLYELCTAVFIVKVACAWHVILSINWQNPSFIFCPPATQFVLKWTRCDRLMLIVCKWKTCRKCHFIVFCNEINHNFVCVCVCVIFTERSCPKTWSYKKKKKICVKITKTQGSSWQQFPHFFSVTLNPATWPWPMKFFFKWCNLTKITSLNGCKLGCFIS